MLKLTIVDRTHQATLTLFNTTKKLIVCPINNFIKYKKICTIFFTSNKMGKKKNLTI